MTAARMMTIGLRRLAGATSLALSLALAVTTVLQAGSKPEPAPVPPPAPSPVAPVVGPQGYSYNPDGRRDPFVSLINRGSEMRPSTLARPEGLPGAMVDEVVLRGIVFSRGSHVAMIQAPDGKSYTIRAGDRLMDGTVKAITATAVIFVQQVNDPLSLVKQREIRKPLRPTEEGK
jgi:type IV pilus assembly protein PilP